VSLHGKAGSAQVHAIFRRDGTANGAIEIKLDATIGTGKHTIYTGWGQHNYYLCFARAMA
jgi:hypothetical protein